MWAEKSGLTCSLIMFFVMFWLVPFCLKVVVTPPRLLFTVIIIFWSFHTASLQTLVFVEPLRTRVDRILRVAGLSGLSGFEAYLRAHPDPHNVTICRANTQTRKFHIWHPEIFRKTENQLSLIMLYGCPTNSFFGNMLEPRFILNVQASAKPSSPRFRSDTCNR